MNLINKPTRLFAAILALCPAIAMAQGANVVPPPDQPGVVVQGPQAVHSVNPAVATPLAQAGEERGLIDIALPSASLPLVDLTPSAPVTTVSVSSRPAAPAAAFDQRPSTKPAKAKDIKVTVDPFAGLVVTPVSDSQLNRFVFPEPLEGIYFSEGAPLPECHESAGPNDPCKPVFLNGKRMMLLQFRAGATGPVQMLAHLHSGRIITLNLAPTPGPGALVRVDGAEEGASDARLAAGYKNAQRNANGSGMSGSEANVALLSEFARGDIPPEFEVELIGGAVRFEFFDVIPQSAWGNGHNLRVHLFQIRAHGNAPVAINAGLFRTENVQSLALDRETITYNEPAMLYMLEYVPENR